MKKTFLGILLCCFIFIAYPSFAQDIKTITLDDGSQIKGKILSVSDDLYTVETSFGEMEINGSQIMSIGRDQMAPTTQNPPPDSSTQMKEYQQKIVSDPAIMSDIQTIVQDEEVIKAFSDPDFMKAVMAQDFAAMQNNPKFQKLLQNPRIQDLINKTSQKFDM